MKLFTNFTLIALGIVLSAPVWSACPAEGRVQLQIIGSGGPAASGGRASASYVLWIDGVSRVMVDAGSGTKDQFHASGASLNDVDLVAISHFHPDHSVELPGILWPRGGNFRVSGPTAGGPFPSMEQFLERSFGPEGTFNTLQDRIELEPFTVDVSGPEPVEVWRDGDIVVTGRSVPHGNVPTVGYRVDIGDQSIAFTSDQNGSDASFNDFIMDVDVLVIHLAISEGATGAVANLHAQPSVWGKMATTANAGHVVVSHISTSSQEQLEASLAILRENYSGEITVGEDLMCIEIR